MPDGDLQEWHDHLFDLLALEFTMRHATGVKLATIRERIANIRVVAAQLRCLHDGCSECRRAAPRPS